MCSVKVDRGNRPGMKMILYESTFKFSATTRALMLLYVYMKYERFILVNACSDQDSA